MTAPAQNPITFDDPAPIGAARPRVRDIVNRLVFVQPTVIERVPKMGSKTGEMEDRITANITVVDGGPLDFGGAPEKDVPVPHTHRVATPYTADGVFVNQVNMVTACRKSLPSAARPQGGITLGVIAFGKQSDPTKSVPIMLNKVEQTDPRYPLASALLQAIIAGSFVNPDPIEIIATVAAAPAQAGVDPAYAAFLAAQAAAAAPVPVAAPPVDPAYVAWQAAQAAAATAAAPVAAPPAGWTPEVWATLSPAQHAAILGAPAAASAAPPL